MSYLVKAIRQYTANIVEGTGRWKHDQDKWKRKVFVDGDGYRGGDGEKVFLWKDDNVLKTLTRDLKFLSHKPFQDILKLGDVERNPMLVDKRPGQCV